MRTCKTCRKYKGCLESSREYPCRDWERRDKHDRRHDGNNTTAAGDQPDPAGAYSQTDHRPGKAQAHPAQAGAEGQVSEVADQGSIRIAGDEHGPVGDYLYIAGGTDLRGGEYGGRRNENTERTGRAVGRFLKKQLPSSCCNHSDRRTDSSCRRYCVNTEY